MSKPIKVLQVFGSLNMGGAESRMMDIYRNIDQSEIKFDFVSLLSDKQFYEDEILALESKIYKIHSPREIGVLKHIKELRSCIRSDHYSAVHAHTSYHCGIVMLAAWLEHVPIRITHARTTGSKSKSRFKNISVFMGRILINMFSTDKFAISKMAGEFLFGNRKFEVIPNAIEVIKYQKISENELFNLRKELNLQRSDFVIGQIGRFDPMKNHLFTIKWFNELLKTKPNSMLILVGDGNLKSDVINQVNYLKIQDNVVFTGIRSDVCRLLNVFDVLFFPSIFEGLGGVAIEAQAAGVPVVESDSIPSETDLDLGLVQRLSLDDDLMIWIEAVDKAKYIQRPSPSEINEKFCEKGYTISSAVNKLTKVYKRYF